MTSIDPDVRALLEQMSASLPAPADFDVAAFRKMVEENPAPPSHITLAAVDDTTIPGPGGPLPLRFYRPNLDRGQPAIVFVHGGGFIQRGLDSHDALCRRLAAGTSSVVVAVDCRPAPEHPYPAAVDDTYATLLHIHREADALGLDPSRVALGGVSAGGTIAAGTALWSRDAGGPRVALQILMTPLLQHREQTPSRQANRQGYGVTTAFVDWTSDQYAPGDLADEPYCAPLRADDLSCLPPAFIHTAELDPLRDDGTAYAQRLAEAGVPVEHRDAPGLFHGFESFPEVLPAAREEVTIQLDTIRRLLTGGGP
jgi:acetyl esterase